MPVRVLPLLPPVAVAYVLLAMATPLSDDFIINFVAPIGMEQEAILGRGLLAPWLLSIKWYYGFLLRLGLAPVQRPAEVIGTWYFQASSPAYLLLLTLKLPVIIFTFISGIALYSLARSMGATADRASTTMLLWFANPVVVITTAMWGHWDVVALSFTLLSMILLLRRKPILSSLALLVGAVAKVIPIVLLPVYLTYLYRTRLGAFVRFTITSAAFLIFGAVAVLWFGGDRLTAGIQRVFSFYFPFFAGVILETVLFQLSSTVVALSLLILLAAKLWRFQEHSFADLLLTYVLVFFALAFWHPPYLVYIMALMMLDYARTQGRPLLHLTLILTSIGASVIVFGFYFSSWGHSVFFIPNYNALMQELSFFILMLPGHPLYEPLGVVLHSVFAAACLYYAAMIFLRNMRRNSLPAFTGLDSTGKPVPRP